MPESCKSDRFFTIYKITNPLGKVYIGKTCNLSKRKYAYRKLECRSQPLIYRSINKYGWENHDFEIIEHLGLNLF